MNKTKFFAFIAFAAILSACGSDDDGGGPPELVDNNLTISPYDTLAVKFNSDLVDYETASYVSSNGELVGKIVGREVRFIGKKLTDGGSRYFAGGSNSIEFTNLKNSGGYVKDRTVFYFHTIPILEQEPNAAEAFATNIESYKDIIGDLRAGDEILFSGILDSIAGVTATGQELTDNRDFYTLKLKVADTVFVTIENREPLEFTIKGPEGIADIVPKTIQTEKGKSNSLTYAFGLEYLLDGSHSANDLVPFYISVVRITPSPNPYTMRIRVVERKR